MPTLADAVLLAATHRPGQWTAPLLAEELDLVVGDVNGAVSDLRRTGALQKRRGNPRWQGTDRLRASKAGRERCRETLRAVILGAEA